MCSQPTAAKPQGLVALVGRTAAGRLPFPAPRPPGPEGRGTLNAPRCADVLLLLLWLWQWGGFGLGRRGRCPPQQPTPFNRSINQSINPSNENRSQQQQGKGKGVCRQPEAIAIARLFHIPPSRLWDRTREASSSLLLGGGAGLLLRLLLLRSKRACRRLDTSFACRVWLAFGARG